MASNKKKLIYLRLKEAFCPVDTSFFYIKDQMVDTTAADFKMKLNCLDQRFIRALRTKDQQILVDVMVDTCSKKNIMNVYNPVMIEKFLQPFIARYGQFEIRYNYVNKSDPNKTMPYFFVLVNSK